MDDGLDDIRLTIAIAAVGYLFCPVCCSKFPFPSSRKKSSVLTTAIFFLSEFPQQGPK